MLRINGFLIEEKQVETTRRVSKDCEDTIKLFVDVIISIKRVGPGDDKDVSYDKVELMDALCKMLWLAGGHFVTSLEPSASSNAMVCE